MSGCAPRPQRWCGSQKHANPSAKSSPRSPAAFLSRERETDHSAETPKDNSFLATWGSELREVINNLQRTSKRSLGTLAPTRVAELNLVPSEKDFFFFLHLENVGNDLNEADARHYDLSAWNEHRYGPRQHVVPGGSCHGQGVCGIWEKNSDNEQRLI